MNWLETLNQTGLKGVGVATKGLQAAASIPAHHRLFNAGLMGIGWLSGNWLREIIFAQKHDGTEITRDEVPAALRFMHGIIPLNQFADDHSNRWKKVVYQLMPAVGAAFGAYYGSQLAFERHTHDPKTGVITPGLEQQYRGLQSKVRNNEKISMLDGDNLASYAVSKPLRVLAGIFSIFSAASGLTVIYGLFLGAAFATSSNRTVFAGNIKDVWGPARATAHYIKSAGRYARAAATTGGAISEDWAAMFARNVIKPLFPGKSEEEIRKHLQTMIQESYDKVPKNKASLDEIEKNVSIEIKELFNDTKFPQTLVKLGFKPEEIRKANLGNGVPWALWPVKKVQEIIEKLTGHKGQLKLFQERMVASLPSLEQPSRN